MNAPIALLHRVEKALESEARENLITRFVQGDKVGKFDLRDLLDCELSGQESYQRRLEEILDILDADPMERSAMIDKLYAGLIERHLDSHPDIVHDEMNALEEDTHAD